MSALTDTVKSVGKGRIIAMAVSATILVAFFLVIALRMTTGNLVPLYTDLSVEDSSKIVSELEKSGVPYELGVNGTQIMVPADRVLRLRMSMAEAGLPSTGSLVGYEIFDRSESFGSSSFVMNVNMARALEGELARTIGSLTDVESARVHLVMPKHELFSREKEKPSASVTIKMRGGHSLERAEVTAVTHLIASAVPGLDSSRVTVVDNHGRLMARGDGGEGIDAMAGAAQEYRVAYETRMQNTLEELLEKVIGAGKVRVQVAADMNFDRVITNSEKYDPDGQVARSTQSSSETEKSQDKTGKENVSVSNNLPQGAAPSSADNGASNSRTTEHTNETSNYEISKVVQNHVSEGGTLNKVSVAALVDGTYAESSDGKEGYTPRTEDEMKQLKTLIASAIGYDEKRGDKIEVVNMRFTQESFKVGEESFFERFKLEMQSIIQTLIIAVVAILAILLVLRPAVAQLIKSAQTPSDRASSELAALEPGAGVARLPGGGGAAGGGGEPEATIDIANIKGGMKSSTMRQVNEIVDKYPEETMNVLRSWSLKQS